MTLGRAGRRVVVSWVLVGVSVLTLEPAAQARPSLERGRRGMVASAHALASEAGLAVMQQGGNAVDGAVATTLAISVVEPFSAGIGGGGFLLLRLANGDMKALDFRERAPLAATRTMYLNAQGQVQPQASRDGYRAVGVPGTVAGLYEVHQRYGKLPWRTVVQPSIQLATHGFVVSPRLAQAIQQRPLLREHPEGRRIFTRQGTLLEPGDRLVQADLAQTLRAIAQEPQSFYRGWIARAIATDMAQQGGLITLTDLKQYRPIWRTPICGTFRVYRVCSMPPPSSGGVLLLQLLNLLSDVDFKTQGWHHPDGLHQMIEAMRSSYADRARYLGDPDFVQVPVAALTSPAYARLRRQEIDPKRARPSRTVQAGDPQTLQRLTQESGETSHLSVVDGMGNAVSLTFTVNLGFGAGVIARGTGIVLNNEMDDFAAAPDVPNAFGLVGGEANAIAPGKTPLSSMTPTIVTQNGHLRLVTGAPGGSTIITTVLQVVLNVLVYGMDAQQAVSAPRLHHQWLPDEVWLDQWGFDALTLADLRQRGHTLKSRSAWGNAMAIVRQPDGWLEGAADPRGEGATSGF